MFWGWQKYDNIELCSTVDRSQSLFYFVPQEKGLIWRPCWGWKSMGESNFHCENGPPQTKMHSNVWEHMPRVQEHLAELIFVHFSGRGNWFSKGYLSVWTICCKMDKAALPIYRDTYEFRAFPGTNHKTMWNESCHISSNHQLTYYPATSTYEENLWLSLWAYHITLFSDNCQKMLQFDIYLCI